MQIVRNYIAQSNKLTKQLHVSVVIVYFGYSSLVLQFVIVSFTENPKHLTNKRYSVIVNQWKKPFFQYSSVFVSNTFSLSLQLSTSF